MKSFFKGIIFGAILICIINFFSGFIGKCTLTEVKNYYNTKFNNSEKKDTLSNEDVNLNIAKALQEKYGADSLMIYSISSPSNKYEYYVSGIKGVKDFDNTNHRLKRVAFSKFANQYRINVIYDSVNGSIITIENDNRPIDVTISSEITPIVHSQPQQQVNMHSEGKKDSLNQNNMNIGK